MKYKVNILNINSCGRVHECRNVSRDTMPGQHHNSPGTKCNTTLRWGLTQDSSNHIELTGRDSTTWRSWIISEDAVTHPASSIVCRLSPAAQDSPQSPTSTAWSSPPLVHEAPIAVYLSLVELAGVMNCIATRPRLSRWPFAGELHWWHRWSGGLWGTQNLKNVIEAKSLLAEKGALSAQVLSLLRCWSLFPQEGYRLPFLLGAFISVLD